jgi:hypothetical protein
MSFSYPGGIISSTENVPTTTAPYCGGIWRLSEAAYWKGQGQWPFGPFDPNFENVTLLLNGDGTNGAQNNTFLDSSTNNFTITRNGNTTQGSFSPYGSNWSNYFNGSSSIGFTNSSSFNLSSSNWTIEAWIFPTATGSYPVIAGVYSDTITNASFFWSLGNGNTNLELYVYVGSSNSSFVATNAITLNAWNHVAAVRNGNTVIQYVNGVQVSSTSFTQTINNSTQQFTIGNVPSSTNYFYNGYVSNVRYVVGTAVYTSAFTPSTTPLTAITNTQLLTCQSNRFIDNSSNNLALASSSGSPSVQRFSPFNPTAPYSTSVIGGSGYFDGSGDYLTAASNSAFAFGTGDFTMECWYYSGIITQQTLLDTRSTSNGPGVLMYTLNNLLQVYANGGNASGSLNVPSNSWVHLVVERISGALYTYVNGARDINGSSFTVDLTQNNFTTGFDIPFGGAAVNGFLANMRIVKGTAVYSGASFSLPTTPLTAVSGTSVLLNTINAGIPDLAMQNNLETVGNAQVSTSVKKYGTGSLAFDGTGDWLQVPNTPNLQLGSGNFTIECWINFSSLASNRGIMYFGTNPNSNFSYGLQWASNALYFWYTTNGSNLASVSASWTPSTSVWYHLAVTRSGNDLKFFIDGTQIGTTQSLSGVTIFNSTDVIRVGGEATGSPNSLPGTMNGYIDDMRITKGLARYTANFTPPTAALPTY